MIILKKLLLYLSDYDSSVRFAYREQPFWPLEKMWLHQPVRVVITNHGWLRNDRRGQIPHRFNAYKRTIHDQRKK